MRVDYDRTTDILTISFSDAEIKDSDEVRPGVIADFGADGAVVGFEVLGASKIVTNAQEMRFAIAG